ncbi:MAG: hypothetical protein AVDCRST_MAG56-7588, partial [uncultured Cytophagales bacterium]
ASTRFVARPRLPAGAHPLPAVAPPAGVAGERRPGRPESRHRGTGPANDASPGGRTALPGRPGRAGAPRTGRRPGPNLAFSRKKPAHGDQAPGQRRNVPGPDRADPGPDRRKPAIAQFAEDQGVPPPPHTRTAAFSRM